MQIDFRLIINYPWSINLKFHNYTQTIYSLHWEKIIGRSNCWIIQGVNNLVIVWKTHLYIFFFSCFCFSFY